MRDINRIIYLIAKGEASNAGSWARKLAKDAFSDNYHLRAFDRAA